MEREVAEIYTNGLITVQVLQKIEGESWSYKSWWPKLSTNLPEPLAFQEDITSPQGRHNLVAELQKRLLHIEVVSVLLRFLYPQHFGIMSPPVTNLLALPTSSDHVECYTDYISLLEKLANKYRENRIADVDMGLWAAAHLLLDTKYRAAAEEMRNDEYFQEIRLRNLLADFGGPSRQTHRYQILFAKALLQMDYSVAALIAARYYEVAVRQMHRYLKLPRPSPPPGQSKTRAMVDQLKECFRLDSTGIDRNKVGVWWDTRNHAVHEDWLLKEAEAKQFVSDMEELMRTLSVWQQKHPMR